MSFARPILSDSFPKGIAKRTETVLKSMYISGTNDGLIPVSLVLTIKSESVELPSVKTATIIRKKE